LCTCLLFATYKENPLYFYEKRKNISSAAESEKSSLVKIVSLDILPHFYVASIGTLEKIRRSSLL
jgi:hypothetical protein